MMNTADREIAATIRRLRDTEDTGIAGGTGSVVNRMSVTPVEALKQPES